MAYVIDTPSRRPDSHIILTLADVGRRSDSALFHTSANMLQQRNACTTQIKLARPTCSDTEMHAQHKEGQTG